MNISNIILGEVNGVPSLPVFIGNYLLDLLSEFFPIFLILVSFSMIYIAFTRGGGDWKQTLTLIAPSFVSIFVILGLLSMKTPYKGSDGGDFWKDTSSYTIVEMLSTFVGFGEIFANALTEKMIYGSISHSQGSNPEFDGYFPNMLQAQIKASHELNLEKKNEFKKLEEQDIEVENKILDMEKQVAIEIRKIVNEMQEVGFLNNPHTISFGVFAKNSGLVDIHGNEDYSFTILRKSYNLNMFDVDEKIVLSDKKFNNNHKFLSFEPTFEKEIYMANAKLLKTKIEEYKIYKNIVQQISDKEQSFYMSDYGAKKTKMYEEKMILVEEQINMIARLQKDMNSFVEDIYKEKLNDFFKDDLNVIRPNYYDSLSFDTTITLSIKEELQNKYNNLKNMTLNPKIAYSANDRHYLAIEKFLQDSYKVKAMLTNELYIKLYNILKEDAKVRLKLQNNSTSIFALTFIDADKLNELVILDGERMTLHKKYIDENTNLLDVKQELNKRLENKDNTMRTEYGLITWYDLGKHYYTFKDLFSPIITSSISNQQQDLAEADRDAKLVKFLQEMEPDEKNERMSSAANWYAAGSFVKEVGGGLINKGLQKIGLKKENNEASLGGVFKAISAIGVIPVLLFFINVVLPAFIWMLVILSYYIEMSIYIAVFPIAFMFMIFQSYRQSLIQYVNVLIGFILLPIVLTSMYFIVLYIDMLLPVFMKQFLPFFSGYDEFSYAFGSTMEGSVVNTLIGWAGGHLMSLIGTTIYTIINLIMSTILLLTFFRGNEYMSKILNVSILGQDNFQGRETINKFSNFNSSSLSKV